MHLFFSRIILSIGICITNLTVKQKVIILKIAVCFVVGFRHFILLYLPDNHKHVFWEYDVTY